MRGTKAKQLRRARPDDAGAIIRRHEATGTCPSCRQPVETFMSIIEPDADGIRFGCPGCVPSLAPIVARLRQGRRLWEARN